MGSAPIHRHLYHPPRRNRNASWAPDGAHLVFERFVHPATTEHLISTVSHDPEFDLYLSEPFPTFSPDGRQLVYSQYANNGTAAGDTSLEIMDADGGGKRILHYETGVASYDASRSPLRDTLPFRVS